MVSVLLLTTPRTARLELAEEEEDEVEVLEPERLPVAAPVDSPSLRLEALDVADVDAAPVEPAETVSPGRAPASEAIVPLVGA